MEDPTDPMQINTSSDQKDVAMPERGIKTTVKKSPPRINRRFW